LCSSQFPLSRNIFNILIDESYTVNTYDTTPSTNYKNKPPLPQPTSRKAVPSNRDTLNSARSPATAFTQRNLVFFLIVI
jgi:hypothetical protein